LIDLNARKFKKLEGTRLNQFKTIDHPVLSNLPQSRYEFSQYKKASINIDYHVELFGHYYSVPYTLKNKTKVFIRYTNSLVEILINNTRVVSHLRDDRKGRHTTIKEHMPKSHQQYLEWSPSCIIRWAESLGEYTGKLVENILPSRSHPEQGYRSCLGVLRLSKGYESERVEAACKRACLIGAHSYKSVRSILEKNLDKQPLPQITTFPTITHKNIRGQHYYDKG
jgi:transposase